MAVEIAIITIVRGNTKWRSGTLGITIMVTAEIMRHLVGDNGTIVMIPKHYGIVIRVSAHINRVSVAPYTAAFTRDIKHSLIGSVLHAFVVSEHGDRVGNMGAIVCFDFPEIVPYVSRGRVVRNLIRGDVVPAQIDGALQQSVIRSLQASNDGRIDRGSVAINGREHASIVEK
jgi:hypothetical protein